MSAALEHYSDIASQAHSEFPIYPELLDGGDPARVLFAVQHTGRAATASRLELGADENAEPGISSAERGPVVNYEKYRAMCDLLPDGSRPSFRALGIIDPGAYQDALVDPNTRWATHNGARLPWIVSVDHAPGYDPKKVRQLTDRADTYLLALPAQWLPEIDTTESAPIISGAIIVETPEWQLSEAQSELPGLRYFQDMQVGEFIDPQIRRAEAQAATMGMFAVQMVPTQEALKHLGQSDFKSAWHSYQEFRVAESNPVDPNNEALFFTANDLRGNETLLKQLWEICESRFGEMGEHHPVSMEESQEFFEAMLLDEGTNTIVKFYNGKPVCFGNFLSDLNACFWLSESFRQIASTYAESNDQDVMYWPEIMTAKGFNLQSGGVMKLYCELAGRQQKPVLGLFESTNRSALAVVPLVRRYVNQSGALSIAKKPDGRDGEADMLDRLHYWYLAT